MDISAINPIRMPRPVLMRIAGDISDGRPAPQDRGPSCPLASRAPRTSQGVPMSRVYWSEEEKNQIA